ncbi:MAG: MBL fold metallo-hydrolase [Chloroflexi bacterium]|nr:MBL fold metallo-hydrolase [Chloroflexota bacterium]
MKIIQFVTEALGDASYLVIAGSVAAAVDPQRDVRPLLQSAAGHGATIQFVFETHVHNDYVSGGRELAALGAQVVAPANSGLEFPHLAVSDGDEVKVGDGVLRAVAAPGHTFEHTAYIAVDAAGKTQGAFTGGALLMAAAGRSDLLGPGHADELTRLQWETAHRLAAMLPPEAELYPTHGAGSFCSTSGADVGRCGPLAVELARNPALASPSLEAFKAVHLGNASPIPGYYRYMAPINRAGPKVYGEPPKPALLTPADLDRAAAGGVSVVDVRSRFDWAAEHIPGSIEMEDSDSLLAYAGWLLPFNAPLALVAYDGPQAERITTDFFRIGYEDVRGYLPFATWKAGDRPLLAMPTVDTHAAVAALGGTSGRAILDLRYGNEHATEPLPGAIQRPIDQLPSWIDSAGPGPFLLVCGSGQRATMASSFFERRGLDVTVLVQGGASDMLRLMATEEASRRG